ncbi:F-BAR and double SH3 domains protein 2 [Balamuthia mandrillaris]
MTTVRPGKDILRPDRKDFKKGGTDPKAAIVFESLQNMREAKPVLLELMKSVAKYQQLLRLLNEVGLGIAELVSQLSTLHTGDLGEGIKTLSQHFETVEKKKEVYAERLQLDILDFWTPAKIENDYKDVINMEKQFKKQRQQSLSYIRKLEQKTNKAQRNKKKPELYPQMIGTLTQAIQDHDKMLADSLREVIRVERKHLCKFLKQFHKVNIEEMDYHNVGMKSLEEKRLYLRELSGTEEAIPPEVEKLITESAPETMLKKLHEAHQSGFYDMSYSYSTIESAPEEEEFNLEPIPQDLSDLPPPPPESIYFGSTPLQGPAGHPPATIATSTVGFSLGGAGGGGGRIQSAPNTMAMPPRPARSPQVRASSPGTFSTPSKPAIPLRLSSSPRATSSVSPLNQHANNFAFRSERNISAIDRRRRSKSLGRIDVTANQIMQTGSQPTSPGGEEPPPTPPRTIQTSSSMVSVSSPFQRMRVRARKKYVGRDASELSFDQGEVFFATVYTGDIWTGEFNGKTGNFPAHCVEKLIQVGPQ